jgi:cytochrome c-type biogenesis protein CcmH/NrfG
MAGALAFGAQPAFSQASKIAQGPPPPPAEAAPPPKPVWDPLHAAESIEVGKFYLKKGKYGAAIDRFREAARLQPGLAEPYLLLGQTYEKTDFPQKAIVAYREYLKLYSSSPHRKKVQERIKKLKQGKKEQARDDSY